LNWHVPVQPTRMLVNKPFEPRDRYYIQIRNHDILPQMLDEIVVRV